VSFPNLDTYFFFYGKFTMSTSSSSRTTPSENTRSKTPIPAPSPDVNPVEITPTPHDASSRIMAASVTDLPEGVSSKEFYSWWYTLEVQLPADQPEVNVKTIHGLLPPSYRNAWAAVAKDGFTVQNFHQWAEDTWGPPRSMDNWATQLLNWERSSRPSGVALEQWLPIMRTRWQQLDAQELLKWDDTVCIVKTHTSLTQKGLYLQNEFAEWLEGSVVKTKEDEEQKTVTFNEYREWIMDWQHRKPLGVATIQEVVAEVQVGSGESGERRRRQRTCFACRGQHITFRCRTHCANCGQEGHRRELCQKPRVCGFCRGSHNVDICQKKLRDQRLN